jgi:hypothetical protein
MLDKLIISTFEAIVLLWMIIATVVIVAKFPGVAKAIAIFPIAGCLMIVLILVEIWST